MFNPYLYPGTAASCRSRRRRSATCPTVAQRVNQALKALEQAGLLRVEYGGIVVLDLPGLRNFGAEHRPVQNKQLFGKL